MSTEEVVKSLDDLEIEYEFLKKELEDFKRVAGKIGVKSPGELQNYINSTILYQNLRV